MKLLKKFLIFFLAILAISFVSLEAFYFYKLKQINPVKVISEIHHSEQAIDALWITLEHWNANQEVSKIGLEPLSATKFVTVYLKVILFINSADFRSFFPKGMKLSGIVARHHLIKSKHANPHLENAIVSIWVSNNYTAKEALNFLLKTMYYGYQQYSLATAAEFYFAKHPENLDWSETISLVTMSYSPSFYNPYCRQDRLIKKAKELTKKLKEWKPSKYGNFNYTFPSLVKHAEINCTN